MKANILWRNWPCHNLIGHPLSEVVYWLLRPFGTQIAYSVAGSVHDFFLPSNHHGTTGRG